MMDWRCPPADCISDTRRKKVTLMPRDANAPPRAATETPTTALAVRLVFSTCGYPAGYFHLHNPAVKSHR